jgi:uracil-DNA glycosylase
MHKSWHNILKEEFKKEYFTNLMFFLREERRKYNVFPASKDLWNAYLTPFDEVKVVILGQDPYFHSPSQAHGLCFSVPIGVEQPPSLKNILKELHGDLGIEPPNHGNLEPWAEQGVLLINTVLTVREGQAGSHKGKGWEQFTDVVIKLLSDKGGIIFVLWGNDAKSKETIIDKTTNYIITAPHPSPLSAYRGFFGSKPFSTINNFLKLEGKSQINWDLTFMTDDV